MCIRVAFQVLLKNSFLLQHQHNTPLSCTRKSAAGLVSYPATAHLFTEDLDLVQHFPHPGNNILALILEDLVPAKTATMHALLHQQWQLM